MPGYAELLNIQQQKAARPNVTTIERDVPFQWESLIPILLMLLQNLGGGNAAPGGLGTSASPPPDIQKTLGGLGSATTLAKPPATGALGGGVRGSMFPGPGGQPTNQADLLQMLQKLIASMGGIGGIGRR